MGRKQHRSIHQHSECVVHRLVGEQFFSSTNHNDVGARFDQCYSRKIPGSIAFSQQPAALSWIVLANIGSGCYRSGHHPLLGKRQTNSLEAPHQCCTRTGSRIGNETSPVAPALQPLQRLGTPPTSPAPPALPGPPPPLRGLSNGSQIGIIVEVIGDNSHAMTPSPSNPFLHKDGAARFARTSSQADLLLAVYINKEEVE